jgi:hypothetical protein
MTRREQLEIDLAAAELAREDLEAALARAEAALFNSVTDASMIDANRAEAAANVERARARCRQLRSALVELDASVSKAASHGGNKTPVAQSGVGAKPAAPAGGPSIQATEPAVRKEAKKTQAVDMKRKPAHRVDTLILKKGRNAGGHAERPSLFRQAFGLSALILAYLAYFHVDVQLEIAKLPSNFQASHQAGPPARSGVREAPVERINITNAGFTRDCQVTSYAGRLSAKTLYVGGGLSIMA